MAIRLNSANQPFGGRSRSVLSCTGFISATTGPLDSLAGAGGGGG